MKTFSVNKVRVGRHSPPSLRHTGWPATPNTRLVHPCGRRCCPAGELRRPSKGIRDTLESLQFSLHELRANAQTALGTAVLLALNSENCVCPCHSASRDHWLHLRNPFALDMRVSIGGQARLC
jgi:hypothetical protein